MLVPQQLKFGITTVAALPVCNSGTRGTVMAVGDAVAPTYRGALNGGGTIGTLVYCDNSAWTAPLMRTPLALAITLLAS